MPITDSGLGTTWSGAAASFLTALVTDDYQDRLNDARNNSCPILGLIPSTSNRVSGKYIVEPVMFGRNKSAFNNVREGGKLPDPGTTSALLYAYRTRPLFARMLVDGALLRATNKDDVAFIDAVDRDMQSMSDDMAVDFARQIAQGDGSGRLCEVSGTSGADLVDIRLSQSIEGVSTCTTLPTQYLDVGDRLAVVSNAGVMRGAKTILAISNEVAGPPSSARLQLSGGAFPVGTVAGDWIVKCSSLSPTIQDSAFRTEWMGLSGIFSDDGVLDGNGVATLPAGALSYVGTDDFTGTVAANFQGVPVSGNSWNRAIVMSGGGVLRPLTEGLLQLAFSRVEKQNNGRVDMLWSNYGVYDNFSIGLLGEKRYNNTTELRAGWTVVDYRGKPWYVDRNCLENQLFLLGLDGGGFQQHVNTPFQPLDPYGPHWMRLPDEDKYQAPWVMQGNFGVGIRERVGGRIVDLQTATA